MLNRKGFTLIELLIVVVIIGILAAIAIPKFSNTKEKAYVAAMKSDLRNLVTAEESYFADTNVYGNVPANLANYYNASSGVTIAATATGGVSFNALATHSGTAVTCTIAMNEGAVTLQGAPQCI